MQRQHPRNQSNIVEIWEPAVSNIETICTDFQWGSNLDIVSLEEELSKEEQHEEEKPRMTKKRSSADLSKLFSLIFFLNKHYT